MKNLKFYLVIFLLVAPMMAMTAPVQASEADPFIKIDGQYKVRIESSQWEFKIFDMNALKQDLGVNSFDQVSDEVKAEYEVKHRVEMPDAVKGDSIEFNLYSRDVQHGFSINELDLAESLKRPQAGDEFGEVTTTNIELTADELGDDDTERGVTYSAYCHIFCGLGHPDMKVKFVLGGGAFEFGPYVFYGAVLVNIGILGLTVRSILSKIQLVPDEEPVAN